MRGFLCLMDRFNAEYHIIPAFQFAAEHPVEEVGRALYAAFIKHTNITQQLLTAILHSNGK